ncbi:hypothetical protein E2C01_006265 [Portunus trituberculatus]|uniref:Uncharacterized protein n=1 Tax=Portunus trituberculatus TaxID=210409 RepID=A0A5B7CUM5_PORTR|nr:hypothetical protein [Portunus trituberculatus]
MKSAADPRMNVDVVRSAWLRALINSDGKEDAQKSFGREQRSVECKILHHNLRGLHCCPRQSCIAEELTRMVSADLNNTRHQRVALKGDAV